MQMLGGRREGGEGGPTAPRRETGGARPPQQPSGGFNDFEDDIPFATLEIDADPIVRRANKHRREE
jgi:hypothetical protein